MAYMASPEERAKYLRRVENAAGAAVSNGCTPDEVRRAVEAGMAQVAAEQARVEAARSGMSLPGSHEPAAHAPRAATSALDAWAQQVA